jgi:CheY-like chemotaxis protein
VSVLVLVVDDEPDVEALFRQQFRRDLRAQRFVMDFAISGAEALSRIADLIEQNLILILSDINMPGMTGLEMLPKVREMRPDVLIFMITAYGDPETKRKAIEGGATGLLQAHRLHLAAVGDRRPPPAWARELIGQCLRVAQSVSLRGARPRPELGVKPTCRLNARTSHFDPQQNSRSGCLFFKTAHECSITMQCLDGQTR